MNATELALHQALWDLANNNREFIEAITPDARQFLYDLKATHRRRKRLGQRGHVWLRTLGEKHLGKEHEAVVNLKETPPKGRKRREQKRHRTPQIPFN